MECPPAYPGGEPLLAEPGSAPSIFPAPALHRGWPAVVLPQVGPPLTWGPRRGWPTVVLPQVQPPLTWRPGSPCPRSLSPPAADSLRKSSCDTPGFVAISESRLAVCARGAAANPQINLLLCLPLHRVPSAFAPAVATLSAAGLWASPVPSVMWESGSAAAGTGQVPRKAELFPLCVHPARSPN